MCLILNTKNHALIVYDKDVVKFTWYHLNLLFAHTIQSLQVLGTKSHLLYCGIDNEYQISSYPTNKMMCSVRNSETICSDFPFCSFSATEALCVKFQSYFFSSSSFSHLLISEYTTRILEKQVISESKDFSSLLINKVLLMQKNPIDFTGHICARKIVVLQEKGKGLTI